MNLAAGLHFKIAQMIAMMREKRERDRWFLSEYCEVLGVISRQWRYFSGVGWYFSGTKSKNLRFINLRSKPQPGVNLRFI